MNVEPRTTIRDVGPDHSTDPGVDLIVRRQQPVPEAIRSLSAMADPDYVDVFTLTAAGACDWSPEQWARAMFGDVPSVTELAIWRGLLGLRLTRRPSPDYVAGWKIADRGADWLRLEAGSWFLTGHFVVRTGEGQVSLATICQYDRRLAAWLWTPLSAVHRRLAPGLLLDAHRALQQGPHS